MLVDKNGKEHFNGMTRAAIDKKLGKHAEQALAPLREIHETKKDHTFSIQNRARLVETQQ